MADLKCLRSGWKRADLAPAGSRWNSISKLHVMRDVFQDVVSVGGSSETLWRVDDDESQASVQVSVPDEICRRVNGIKATLRSMDDGEISVSAYDTAWVALVEDINGNGSPQFSSSLQWIVDNQLSDGSWGDHKIFFAHDRIINTLACVVALKYWNIYPERCKRGISFLGENMSRLDEEDAEHMPIGFEVAFPSLIEIARELGLEVNFDSLVLKEIHAKRNLKLGRIPKEMMHQVPTTLLHSLEGMPDLDWEKLLKLQSPDGSFLFSPSSTAFALKQTKDEKCLKYLKKAVDKFKGGVPNVYPVDLFEHLWAVDRLERLGISRYFQPEIKDCLDYVYRYWTEDGICWARNSKVRDVDDTSMAFRLLRLHGYDVSADAFRHFEKGGEFFCFAGQSGQAVTGIYNLNRASHVSFPGEKILEDARTFSYRFLREKQASKQLLDKWIITKDLPGEVGFALDFPWYASLPRIETRFYLEQYGGEDDVWIGKTLYRMPYVNNNEYLELAKLDFNNCQALHQSEWLDMQRWYEEVKLREYGVSRKAVLRAYFLAASSISEPDRANERLAWARTAVLMEAFASYFSNNASTVDEKRAFFEDFIRSSSKRTDKGLVGAWLDTLRLVSLGTSVAHRTNVRLHLERAWEDWLMTWTEKEDSVPQGATELLVRTINLCAGRSVSKELLSHPHYVRLATRTNTLCHRLSRLASLIEKAEQTADGNGTIPSRGLASQQPMETEMQELLQYVLQTSDGIDLAIKQTFLTVAKSFYYTAHCSPTNFNLHMEKILFERVV
ncbi:hypothetical protein AAC387_Pa02g2957 [Persea americana]